MSIRKKWGLLSAVGGAALAVLTAGCNAVETSPSIQRQEQIVKRLCTSLQPGMSRKQVDRALGEWGRRHFLKTEKSSVPEGRNEDRQREFEVKKKDKFDLLVPENLLETMPLRDGATEIVHYVFNKRSRFAVGYWFGDLMLFYDALTDILQGYGYDLFAVSGRADLADMEFFYHGTIVTP